MAQHQTTTKGEPENKQSARERKIRRVGGGINTKNGEKTAGQCTSVAPKKKHVSVTDQSELEGKDFRGGPEPRQYQGSTRKRS